MKTKSFNIYTVVVNIYTVNIYVGCVAQVAERRTLAGELTLSCAWPAVNE